MNIKLSHVIYITLLQIGLFPSLANGQDHIIIQHPESSGEPYLYNIEVKANQDVDFQFDLSHVAVARKSDDLTITFLQMSTDAPNTVTLEKLFSVTPAPIIHLLDNSTTTPEGVITAVWQLEKQEVQSSIDAIQALIESGDDIDLPATAAGNSVTSSVPLFSFLGGNLSERFRAYFSSDSSADTNPVPDESETVINAVDSSSRNTNNTQINELQKTSLSLAIVHSQKELEIHNAYKNSINEVYEQVKERADSGLGRLTDIAQVTLWVTQSKQKQAQIQMALDIALDDYEDLMGFRPATFNLYPDKWQEVAFPTLSEQLKKVAVHEQKEIRELWRLISLEKNNLYLQKQLIEVSNEVLDQVTAQFTIGQRSLGEVLSAYKSVYEYAIIENEMHYRAYIGLANLYALTGKLSTQVPAQWRTQQ
ncbi:MAG: hypothetical protein ACJAVV_002410 [Alphaproteobacteria bacterium]|jgi:hypothetical protein